MKYDESGYFEIVGGTLSWLDCGYGFDGEGEEMPGRFEKEKDEREGSAEEDSDIWVTSSIEMGS